MKNPAPPLSLKFPKSARRGKITVKHIAVVILLAAAIYIIQDFFDGPPDKIINKPAPGAQNATPVPAQETGAAGDVDYEKVILDPSLQNIEIEELPLVKDEPQSKEPEKLKTQKLVKILTEPMKNINGKFGSFAYSGEMKVTVPTMVKSEEEFKKGKKYGPGVEISSTFKYKNDKKFQFSLAQTTVSSDVNYNYDNDFYNGELFYYKGGYIFVDADGIKTDKEELIKNITAELEKNGSESLVRRHWIQIIKDLAQVISFQQEKNEDIYDVYSLASANAELQKKTVIINSLQGSVRIHKPTQTLVNASITGDIQFRDGYMSGAQSDFQISLEIHDIDKVPLLAAP